MTATRTAARSDGEGTSALVLAALHLARKLGNPMPALWRTVRASERLLSIATALPDAGPDPYAALRRLLQAKAGPARALSRPERIETQPTPAQSAARMRRTSPERETKAAPTREREVAALDRSPAPPPATQRASDSAAAAVAASESRAKSPFAARGFTTEPQATQLRADPTSSLAPRNDATSATSALHTAASHDPLEQRRRRLRDGLQLRPTRTAPREASSDAPTTATLAALLGSVPLASARTPASTMAEAQHIDPAVSLDAATPQRSSVTAPTAVSDAERAITAPTGGMIPGALPPAARPNVQSRSVHSTAASGPSVRRLLPPSSPLDTFGDVPANTLLDAAFRHGVDPT